MILSLKKDSKGKYLQCNNDPDELSNSRTWMDYMEPDSISNNPGKEDWRKRVIYTMYKFASDKNSLDVMQFCMKYKIPWRTLHDWVNAYPDLENAYTEMKRMIACHRKIGSMHKKLDSGAAYKDMHLLDPDWHEKVNKYLADLRNIQALAATAFNIMLGKPEVKTEAMLKAENDVDAT